MKKIFILLLSALILFTSCSASRVTDKPEDSELDFWITENVGGVDFSEYTENPGWFGAREYYGKGYSLEDEEYVSYLITAYPDHSSGGSFVTVITVTDPDIAIVGKLNCASGLNSWDKELKDMGFKQDELSTVSGLWKSGKITVRIDQTDGKSIFKISAEVTNVFGIQF